MDGSSDDELFRVFRRKTSNKEKAVELLSQYNQSEIKNLVDINKNHKSLLQRACILGWIDVWTSLITKYKCDPRYHVDDKGDTVLHTACQYGHVDLVRSLVSKPWCMDPLMKNKSGVTPLDYSKEHGHIDVTNDLDNILDQENNEMLAKRNHSAISENEPVDTGTTAKKPHGHDIEDDDNMGTRMINEATVESTGKQRKRKTDISVGNSITKKPAFNDDNGNDRTEDNISTFSGEKRTELLESSSEAVSDCSKERLKFVLKSNLADVISLIPDPIRLANEFYSKNYLHRSVRDKVIENQTIPRYEKSSILMNEVERTFLAIADDNSIVWERFNMLCDILCQQGSLSLTTLVSEKMMQLSKLQ